MLPAIRDLDSRVRLALQDSLDLKALREMLVPWDSLVHLAGPDLRAGLVRIIFLMLLRVLITLRNIYLVIIYLYRPEVVDYRKLIIYVVVNTGTKLWYFVVKRLVTVYQRCPQDETERRPREAKICTLYFRNNFYKPLSVLGVS